MNIRSLPMPFNVNLQRREKIIVAVAGGLLVILLLLQLIVFPITDRRTTLSKRIVQKTQALAEIKQLASEYQGLTSGTLSNEARLKNRAKSFTLFSFIDTLAGKSGIKQNIIYMKPSSTNLKGSPYALSIVELKINSLTMEQLVNFLHGVETAQEMIWVKRVSLAKGEKEGQLIDAVLQVETFQL
ncbi:MAG: type II secretion system protein M [Desulfatitalea sp.]|nr:type II secretion system protein M [Desulfatitalea sp.]MBI5896824.1 type II secretion system protein M [Desulfobacterales bacterium]